MKLIEFVTANWMLILIALSSGAMLAWPLVRGAGGGTLTAQGAVQLINRERAVLVDVREPEEFATGHMIGAKNVPLNQLEEKLAAAVKNKNVPLLLVCATGARAQRAVAIAKSSVTSRPKPCPAGSRPGKTLTCRLKKLRVFPR